MMHLHDSFPRFRQDGGFRMGQDSGTCLEIRIYAIAHRSSKTVESSEKGTWGSGRWTAIGYMSGIDGTVSFEEIVQCANNCSQHVGMSLMLF